MGNLCNDLLACKTCGKQIGAMAETCPGCGTPNDWRHPSIQALIDNAAKISTKHPFTFQYTKAKVWGETKPLFTPLSVILLLVVFLVVSMVALLISFAWSLFVSLIGILMVSRLLKKESFQADFSTETWHSSNDRFWKPVIDKIRVEKDLAA